METALISMVSMGLVIIGMMTTMLSFFQSTNTIIDSWKQMEQQSGSIRRTEIATVAPDDYRGGVIDITVINDGQTHLADFSRWDVIAQRYDNTAQYLDYKEKPTGNSYWTVQGLYLPDGSPEVFDINLLNPGEKMILNVKVTPIVERWETCMFTISTPNGVVSECFFTRPG